MATLNMPNDIIFPVPKTPEEAEMQKILNEYFTSIRQVLTEIESKLP